MTNLYLKVVSTRVMLTEADDMCSLIVALPTPAPLSADDSSPLYIHFRANKDTGVSYIHHHFPDLFVDIVNART